MKKSTICVTCQTGAFLVLSLVGLIACNDQIKNTVTSTVNDPVYLSYIEFRATKALQPAQAMVHPGKICLFGNYLYVNEISKGIHIIDNTYPATPTAVAFIDLLGNIDVTISNNILYADSFVDLVMFDVSNPLKPVEVGRAPDVFPNVLPATGNNFPIREIDWSKGVVVDWEVKSITEKEEFYPYHPCRGCYFLESAYLSSWSSSGRLTSSGSTFTSVTGSMSRFAVSNNHLYVVNNNLLKTFSLYGNAVHKEHEQYLSWNVETVFPYNEKLFLGTTSGMLIYDIENPKTPRQLSSITHILGCDPVVVQDDYAYVTIRGGNVCGQNQSFLNVYNISNPAAPIFTASYDLNNPYGLGIDGNTLFVCDGGLAIYDASNPLTIGSRVIKRFSSIQGFDVIPYHGVLILIGNDGLYQYDYTDIQNIKELGSIKISK